MSDLPLKFVAHYEAECGDSYELWNFKSERLKLFCDDCRETHSYKFIYLEHKVWSWDQVEDIWANDGGLTDPHADHD